MVKEIPQIQKNKILTKYFWYNYYNLLKMSYKNAGANIIYYR